MFRQLFIVVIWVLAVGNLIAQQDSSQVKYDNSEIQIQEISDEDLRTYKEDPKFDYEIIETDLTWWDNFKTWLGNLLTRLFEWFFGTEKAVGYLAIFFKIVPYVLLALLIFILIKFFMNVNARAMTYSKNNEAIVTLSEEEHIIKNENIDELIKTAISNKNYRLAIRYYYLLILKQLSEKELIDWEIQKTNDDYINELEKEELKTPFRHITLLYDYIWYGDFPIDEAKYIRAENDFTSLKRILANHG